MQRAEPWCCPLQGQHLIEASAGTGKTFTVVTIYLRLLLGLDKPERRPLRVDQILVVTFTEAATQELRERVRQRIRQLQYLCNQNHSLRDDDALKQLWATIDKPKVAASYLAAAERQMDEAAIMTIHAFCQRILIQQAIDARTFLNQQLVTQEQPLQQQVVADYWRRHFYSVPPSLARVIQQEWAEPKVLFSELAQYLTGDLPKLLTYTTPMETLLARHHRLIAAIDGVKQQWRQLTTPAAELLDQIALNKQRYPTRYRSRWLQEIDDWVQQATEDYQLPDVLSRFRYSVLAQATLSGEPPQHPLFQAIDTLYALPLTLKDLVIAQALPEIRQTLAHHKQQRAEVTFDDLLSQLDTALQQTGGHRLAATIRQRYPAALIDEFQDTDPMQYRIFQTVYEHHPETLLLLIGDPKQAIYAFRGADIFTYMQVRRIVESHYTLQINWRSGRSLVNAVNQLFQQAPAPFVFDQDIPFSTLQTPDSSAQTHFIIQEKVQAALQFHYCDQLMSLQQYGETLATWCASEISTWLAFGQQHQALLVRGTQSRPVEASDIAVLVRTADEALLIRRALGALSIPSVYLSEQQSVFATSEAQELFRWLQVLSYPISPESLLPLLAGSLLMLDANTIEQLHQENNQWDAILDEFADYQQLWYQMAPLPLLQRLLFRRQLPEKLLTLPDGERRLTDLRHLGELLQEASRRLATPQALLRWFSQQIAHPNRAAENHPLRLESDRHLVKIITIHKSKGLEYPLVWLPFPCAFRQQKCVYYHDRQSYQAILDLRGTLPAQQWAEQEQLAESVRLLYVALTRAVFHCSVGVAPVVSGRTRKATTTDLHHSALGYLLQRGEAGDQQRLQQALEALQSPEIKVSLVENSNRSQALYRAETERKQVLQARVFKQPLRSYWQISSYSALRNQHAERATGNSPLLFLNSTEVNALLENPEHLEAYQFPRGAEAGTILHNLLQQLDFTQSIQLNWLEEQLEQQGLDSRWSRLLQQWLAQILRTPLMAEGPCLRQITLAQRCCEMQFYLPVESRLEASSLDTLMRKYDPLSRKASTLHFTKIYGMLQGSIDLVFCWQGRYYLLDYKSNWLGESASSYTRSALVAAMVEHRYDLQYQLYTVALHRYLCQRCPNYQYASHFGGVFYLFLRGMNDQGGGVFFHKPAVELIDALNCQLAS
ncbi:MAG: exodeoxyribonuclease V subunit beta [Candidatus Symbiodolus clandestinus]